MEGIIPLLKVLTSGAFFKGHALVLAPRLASEIIGVTGCAN